MAEAVPLMVARSREKGGTWGPGISFKGTPTMSHFLQLGPNLKVPPPPKTTPPLGTKGISYSNPNMWLL
jgi:hypothetical protein